jgi:hypothetical protein
MDLVQDTVTELMRFTGLSSGVPLQVIDDLEAALGVTLPADVKAVAAVFRGGPIGTLHHFSWMPEDADSVLQHTRRLRAMGLPANHVAIGICDGRLRTISIYPGGLLIEVFGLADDDRRSPTLTSAKTLCGSYGSYHGFVRSRIEIAKYVPVRESLLKKYRQFSRGAARKWRHRWNEPETQQIVQILTRGLRASDHWPTVSVDGREYADLRGVVLSDNQWYAEEVGDGPLLERLDLSFASGGLQQIDMKDCLFRGAAVSVRQSRLRACDLTMIDCDHSMLHGFGGEFSDCNFTGAYLTTGGILTGKFEGCDFIGADLFEVGSDAEFIDCNWESARFAGDELFLDPRRPNRSRRETKGE